MRAPKEIEQLVLGGGGREDVQGRGEETFKFLCEH